MEHLESVVKEGLRDRRVTPVHRDPQAVLAHQDPQEARETEVTQA